MPTFMDCAWAPPISGNASEVAPNAPLAELTKNSRLDFGFWIFNILFDELDELIYLLHIKKMTTLKPT
jgi:hypothetical protein